MKKSLKLFSVITTLGMVFVLIGGALVTKTSSGMGCGRSWPLCEGQFIPTNITKELIIELSHRLVSGSIGLMVLILSFWVWKVMKHKRETKILAITASGFMIIQSLVGAAAVVWGQSDFVLALHFGISLISFAALLLLTLLIFEVDMKFDAHKLVLDKKMRFHIYGITIYSYIVVYTGALVRHKHASLVCPSFPLCTKNRLIPTQMHEWVQMGHRFAATLIFIWIVIATIRAVKYYKDQRVIYYGWILALCLVILQASAGVSIILTNLNLYVALLHSLFITLLFGLLCYLTLLASRSKLKK